MCTAHAYGQDGGGGTRGACICKGGTVLQVARLKKDGQVWD